MSDEPRNTPADTDALPDDRPQRRREYSGASSTLGVAALVILAVGVAIWWFELRGDSGGEATGADGFGIVALADADNPTGKSAVAEVGRAAPNFRLASLEGEPRSLTDFRGKYVVLNFWASWCEPCRSESPELQDLSDRQAERLVVVGVNQEEPPEAAQKFARDFDLTYPLLLDRNGEVAQAYRLPGLPVTYLIDQKGVIVKAFPGRVTGEQLADLEREYLSQ